jgi:general stress protein YciG
MANKENSRTGSQGSQGGSKNPGNFANDRQKASDAGRRAASPQAATCTRTASRAARAAAHK